MDNEKKLNILGLAIKLIIAIPSLIAVFFVMTSNVNGDSDKLVQQEYMNDFWFSSSINISFWAIGIATALILVFFIMLLISRPAQGIKSILGIVISAVLFYILYAIGTTDTLESLNVQGGVSATAGEINFTHAGIITTFILMGISTLLALFMGFFMKFFRN
ncbi:MAG TPA: hypothetical protein VL021_01680 [Brumimicrobium sp.]|nr:hypothetical protein [Brumimicrobium sp.]